jgi:general secretion pathway protein G
MTIRKQFNRQIARRAFTLMEILIVVAIIVVLAGVGAFYFIPRLDESKMSTAEVKAKTLAEAAKVYYVKHSTWPNDISLLVQEGIVKPDAIMDPWNQQYVIDTQGTMNNGLEPDIYTTFKGVRLGNFPRQTQ